jgi:hypothetical protein
MHALLWDGVVAIIANCTTASCLIDHQTRARLMDWSPDDVGNHVQVALSLTGLPASCCTPCLLMFTGFETYLLRSGFNLASLAHITCAFGLDPTSVTLSQY